MMIRMIEFGTGMSMKEYWDGKERDRMKKRTNYDGSLKVRLGFRLRGCASDV